MNNKSSWLIVLVYIILILCLTACSNNIQSEIPSLQAGPAKHGSAIGDYSIIELPIPKSIQASSMEFSGLAWYEEWLVLLPQYPNRGFYGKQGNLYAISKENIDSFIKNNSQELEVKTIPFDDQGLYKELTGFEGYEAIAFVEDQIFLTIETSGGDPMKAFLINGSVTGNLDSIILDKNSLIELQTQNSSRNASYEALTYDEENIYAIYEQNGTENNKSPYVFVTDYEFKTTASIPIDPVNYRITDATMIDSEGNFWAINYFFPGDTHLAVDSDPISQTYGLPETHQSSEPVERLLKFHLEEGEFTVVDNPPLYLHLLPDDEARNWEGIVILDNRGFILVTDSFPETILGLILLR